MSDTLQGPPQVTSTEIRISEEVSTDIRLQQEGDIEIRPQQEGNVEIRSPQEGSSEVQTLQGTSADGMKPVLEFGDLAPDSTWQFNAEAFKEVRDITAKLNVKERLQRMKVGNFTKSKKYKTPKIGHHDTCAIVGNSGVSLGSECGAKIDSKDFVIRIDIPVIQGYEKDVGRRTDMIISNMKTVKRMYESSHFENRSQDVYENRLKNIEGGFLIADVSVLREVVQVAETYKLSFMLLHLTERIRTGTGTIASEIAKKKMRGLPSTGLITVLMSTTFCDRTYMYGFFPFTTDAVNNSVPYHYYPGDYIYPPLHHTTGSHHMDREYDFFRDLHSRGVLKMHVGPCRKL
ncbi:ST8SIA2 [Branchiostoma lanceolatum]|uniref:ST8SIA2 protein n=1 Tax=Branchiostoma lanceolatum TaxID=7740 RepID=A0A8J9YZ19_BRALA|nr:ST8SIA2 [Branchiostoma lanceolatum]